MNVPRQRKFPYRPIVKPSVSHGGWQDIGGGYVAMSLGGGGSAQRTGGWGGSSRSIPDGKGGGIYLGSFKQ